MAKVYVIVIGLVSAAMAFVLSQNSLGIIIALITVALVSAIPFLLDLVKDKNGKAGVFGATLGLVLGLIGFACLYPLLKNFPESYQWSLAGVLMAAVSYVFYSHQREGGIEISRPVSGKKPAELMEKVVGGPVSPKILDTSIVIDGRIIDLANTGFIEGPLVVPNFVLREIQLISDSADSIKRNRGRRGLDMLNTLQKSPDLEVKISYIDYPDTREVDAKLVRLAKDMSGKLVTNDFNLNKVAELQNIEVLNINNLANAIKPVVLPGEEMEIQVIKEGKDENQGIGYLDDGTMVVIENGGKLLGKRLKVNVTSIIQTNAGKMIFTKVAGKN